MPQQPAALKKAMIQAKSTCSALRTAGPLLLFCLTACAEGVETSISAPAVEPGVTAPTRTGPADAPEGTCWGKTITPAVVEHVTERIEITPAEINPDGTIAKPPAYRNDTRQVIVKPRADTWFETPCPALQTPEFIASLQRALQARGLYAGKVSGEMTAETSAAVERFQRQSGLNSSVLSLETARALGLIAVDRATLTQPG